MNFFDARVGSATSESGKFCPRIPIITIFFPWVTKNIIEKTSGSRAGQPLIYCRSFNCSLLPLSRSRTKRTSVFHSLVSLYFSESPWHLTIGGAVGESAFLNSAELFNWKTGVQCFIEPLPQVNL